MRIWLLLFLTSVSFVVTAQQNVGIGTAAPNSSAMLDVNSTTKGMLLPRLTTSQRKAIAQPALGLLVFDTDKGTLMFFDGSAWRALSFTDENKIPVQNRGPQDPVVNAGFGARVSISGDYAIVGAPRFGTTVSNMGLAYIFNKTSNGWTQVARLAAKDSTASSYFGGAVAISGDYAIVGCPSKQVNANSSQGKVYVYHRTGSNWGLDTAFTKPNGAAFEDFGWSVGICAFNTGGPAVAIGIPYSDAGGVDKGEVYFYRKTTTNWAFIQNIVPTDLAVSDYYGTTIAMDTDYVAIGATGQDNITYNLSDAGAAYIYAYGGGVWNFQQKLQGSVLRGQFGFALSLSSNKLAVGAPWAATYSNTSSTVYIYQRTGATWNNITSFFIYNYEIIPNANQIQPVGGASSISIANITFGISVSLSGNTLLVGASGGSDYPNGGASYYSDRMGAVYVYKSISGNGYTRTRIIQSDSPVTGDLFGECACISGNQYIIGSPHATVDGLANAGNIYFGSE